MTTNPLQNPDQNGDLNEHKDNDHFDNDTYGHVADPESFKKKSEPQHQNAEDIDVSEKLKNQNITSGDDISSRNRNEQKGVGGKDI